MEPVRDVLDVDEASFERDVVERSAELPVVVDFWAPWCGPCRFLAPLLERLVGGEFRGRLALAKVNTDDFPGLARRFAIQGIPAVKVFRDRVLVAEFVGALPEEEVRRVLLSVLPSPADLLAGGGAEQEASGDLAAAEASYLEAIALDRFQARALLGLGRIHEARGDATRALEMYRRVPGSTPEESEAARRMARLDLAQHSGDGAAEAGWTARLERDARDVEAHYELGLRLAARACYREALEHLLEVVRLDRKFRDDAGRKAMLQVFDVVGTRSEIADEFRARLASAIF